MASLTRIDRVGSAPSITMDFFAVSGQSDHTSTTGSTARNLAAASLSLRNTMTAPSSEHASGDARYPPASCACCASTPASASARFGSSPVPSSA